MAGSTPTSRRRRPRTLLPPQLRGQVIAREDAAFAAYARVLAIADEQPLCAVRCANLADVMSALRYAGQHQLCVTTATDAPRSAAGLCMLMYATDAHQMLPRLVRPRPARAPRRIVWAAALAAVLLLGAGIQIHNVTRKDPAASVALDAKLFTPSGFLFRYPSAWSVRAEPLGAASGAAPSAAPDSYPLPPPQVEGRYSGGIVFVMTPPDSAVEMRFAYHPAAPAPLPATLPGSVLLAAVAGSLAPEAAVRTIGLSSELLHGRMVLDLHARSADGVTEVIGMWWHDHVLVGTLSGPATQAIGEYRNAWLAVLHSVRSIPGLHSLRT